MEKTAEQANLEAVQNLMKRAEVGSPPLPPALEQFAGRVDRLVREFAGTTGAVAKYAVLRRLEEIAARAQAGLVPDVNRDLLAKFACGVKQHSEGGCIFKPYHKPDVVTWPPEVLRAEQELAVLKQTAKDAGTALRKEAQMADGDKRFSASVAAAD